MAPAKKPTNPAMLGNMLNLERVPVLAPKFSNQIGKTCAGFGVMYTPEGVKVVVKSTIDGNGQAITGSEDVSLPEWERRRVLKNTPSREERLSALSRKFELRLNKAFPQGKSGPSSGKEEDIATWLQTLPFGERRALLMSQKDYAKAYPNGIFRAQGAE